MPTLPFGSVSDIRIVKLSTSIEFTIGSTVLGSINTANPVCIYVTVSGGTRSITLQNIAMAAYTAGNTNNPNTDTIQLRLYNPELGFNVQCCNTNTGRYKIIGWETDTIGQTCTGGNRSNAYYDISAPGNFKAMLQTVGGELMMVARYASAVNNPASVGNPACDPSLYCYSCIF